MSRSVSGTKWSIKELLKVTTDYLKKKEIENPRLCAEILLAFQLETTRVNLYLDFGQPVSERDVSGYRCLIKRRLKREPVQYITGKQEFWSKEFLVGPEVLIPRPETEILVEQVVSLCREGDRSVPPNANILDLGTGSGAIAIALAGELKEAAIWASDISKDSLDIAKLNADRHHVTNRMHFKYGDLFQPFVSCSLKLDVIVSNPPYIAPEEYDSLPPEVRDYEPKQALFAREGGLFFIEKIIRQAPDYLCPGGWLLVEMDPRQISRAFQIMDDSGRYSEKKPIKDYSHKDRVIAAKTRA